MKVIDIKKLREAAYEREMKRIKREDLIDSIFVLSVTGISALVLIGICTLVLYFVICVMFKP